MILRRVLWKPLATHRIDILTCVIVPFCHNVVRSQPTASVSTSTDTCVPTQAIRVVLRSKRSTFALGRAIASSPTPSDVILLKGCV
jgi:hypothetical protein